MASPVEKCQEMNKNKMVADICKRLVGYLLGFCKIHVTKSLIKA